jgi:hypothetical protein
MRRLTRPLAWLGLFVAPALFATPARADVLLYSNVSNFTGFATTNSGAANVGGDNITTMVADDITPPGGLGGTVDAFVFSVANLNTTAVAARPLVRFYAADGAGGGPGTYITGFDFAPVSFGATSVALFTDSNGGRRSSRSRRARSGPGLPSTTTTAPPARPWRS